MTQTKIHQVVSKSKLNGFCKRYILAQGPHNPMGTKTDSTRTLLNHLKTIESHKYASPKIPPVVPRCIRNTKESMNDIRNISSEALPGTEKEHTRLAIGDVTPFYTNVHIPTALSRIKQVIQDNPKVTPLIPANDIGEVVNLVTKANCFELKGRRFHQIADLAMGSPCSTTITRLYLATVEKPLLINDVYSRLGNKRVLAHSRYIDNISLIYKGPRQSLGHFLRITNGEFAPLSIVWNIHKSRRVSLDTEITSENDVITTPHMATKLYRTPMNTYMYISPPHHGKTFFC